MADPGRGLKAAVKKRFNRMALDAPWAVASTAFRLLYKFKVQGEEHLPARGPYLLAINEASPIASLVSGWLAIKLVNRSLDERPDSTMVFMQEDLWTISYFNKVEEGEGLYRPLNPNAAGRLALNLLDGYRLLRDGGIVILNAEGEMTWDGRPLPIRPSLAWLALHTAAPIVPALCLPGAYDIWPRWQGGPSRTGRLTLAVGEPFRVCDAPLARFGDADLAQASAQVEAAFQSLRYGPGGVAGWAGPALCQGEPFPDPLSLLPPSGRAIVRPAHTGAGVRLRRRGMAQLLWRCPVCGTDDALTHARPRLRAQSLSCGTCGTRWAIRRVLGHDFRLEATAGPRDVLGLDLPLSRWYHELKAGFRPVPRPVKGLELRPGEQAFLEAPSALHPHRPNPLFEGWAGREAPGAPSLGRHRYADWPSLGEGRLVLTDQRMVWQGPERELDFEWPRVTGLSLFLVNTLGVRYGTAQYRLTLGQEAGLKWFTYTATLARQAPGPRALPLALAPY